LLAARTVDTVEPFSGEAANKATTLIRSRGSRRSTAAAQKAAVAAAEDESLLVEAQASGLRKRRR
jgi:hypothetical protein